ncbi:MAG: hypothetical protein Q4D17_04290 [Planctomycetia bacterium]|nr:hypothetical protein [Planctomycetia bacterium]
METLLIDKTLTDGAGMCLVNKILIGLVVIAIGVCFYFSAITLKTHSVWREEGNKQAKQLKQLQEEILVFEYGKGQPETEGYVRSLFEQEKYLRALQDLRGPVFRDCRVRNTFANDRLFHVTIPGITEVQLPVNTPLYAFRPTKNDPEKMEYLGRFTVRKFGIDGDTAQPFVSIEPTRVAYEVNERMTATLADRSMEPWTLFFNMPIDKAEYGSENEDYLPFDTRIQYYVDQEYILQDFIAKQTKHLDYMKSLIGEGAELGEYAMEPIAKTIAAENKIRLGKVYDNFAQENQAMKQANQALAARVAELERKKAGYQDSINMRVKPIQPGQNAR